MTIANSCGHPDCANMAEMLKQVMGDLSVADLRLEAAQNRIEDWQKLANDRSAEIIRLMAENEALRAELAKGGRD